MKWIIWSFVGLLVIAAGIIGFFWYQTYNAQGIAIEMEGPRTIQVGVPFELSVSVKNDSQAILEKTRLSLSLPEGMIFLAAQSGQDLINKEIGSLGKGSLSKESFQILALDAPDSIRKIKARLSYVPGTLGASLEQQEEFEITIANSGVLLDMSLPRKVFRQESFDIEMSYENISQELFEDFQIRLNYPPGFNFSSSSLPAEFNNQVFNIGNLQPGSKNTFYISGTLDGPDNAFFDIEATASAEFFGDRFNLNSQAASISLAASPLELSIQVNEKSEYIAKPGDSLRYELRYKNNTSVALRDVIISAKLIGEFFDFEEIEVQNGSFSPFSNTVSWNGSQIPALRSLNSGQEGMVSFRARSKAQYPIERLSDKNFSLEVRAEIESPTVPAGVASNKTIGSAQIGSKVAGALFVDAFSKHRDASSGIINDGPYPLQAGETTQFTIHWQISSASTDMENVTLRAFLGPNVSFTGEAKSTTGTLPSYNERTQEISWKVDLIPATTGYISKPVETIFQVEIRPSTSQANQEVVLVNEVNLSALDLFTEQSFRSEVLRVTSNVRND